MKLVENWRQAWRWWSVRLSALGTLLSAAALAFPDALIAVWHIIPAARLARLPAGFVAIAPLLLFAGVLAARIIQQRRNDDDR